MHIRQGSRSPGQAAGEAEKRRLYAEGKQLCAYGELHKGVFFSPACFGGASEIRRKVRFFTGKPLTERRFPSYNWGTRERAAEPPPGLPRFFQRKIRRVKAVNREFFEKWSDPCELSLSIV